ncbi:hypothetical protein H5P28_11675 [Ruficoccus amylovorans]|uniref:Uncharacterized protein n=1 Tax=Ruficoccus amylovorans TaxID=1804625 RepID=A0A842HH96_9BACT|nr:hypothetical protein [Ruficoccus amylovorans]MBC2594917.1 hypothetical protein [Ruficoccus amylovorans]
MSDYARVPDAPWIGMDPADHERECLMRREINIEAARRRAELERDEQSESAPGSNEAPAIKPGLQGK